jgi:molecular chaperone GrpE
MSNDNKPTANDNAAPPPPADQAGVGPETAAAPEVPRHHDDLIADLRREVSDLKDRILRAHAEVENMRKRTEREKEETAKYAVTRFARDILSVGDNFQRALQAVPAGAAEADPALKSLIEGVTLTERELLNVLERYGVKKIEAMGQKFDPHLHQAVMQAPNPDVPENTIMQVFQAGFTIEDRTLRPAMVVVATGGPKPSRPGSAPEAPPSADAAPPPPPETA